MQSYVFERVSSPLYYIQSEQEQNSATKPDVHSLQVPTKQFWSDLANSCSKVQVNIC